MVHAQPSLFVSSPPPVTRAYNSVLKQSLSLAVVFLAGLSGLRAADNLQLGANENLFYVLAAINAAGYDEGINLPDNHPFRRELREHLAQQNIPVLPDLHSFYRKHLQKTGGIADLSQYISYALSVTGPPYFEWRTRSVDVPPDAMVLAEFTPLLIDFYQQAKLDELWKKAQPAIEKEEEKYHSPLVAMTNTIDGYLRVSAGGYLGRRFSVFVDLLGAPEQIQAKNYGDDAFVVVTPSAKPSLFDIRHAYLHFEIDPICIKYGIALDLKRTLLDYVQNAPLDMAYKNDVVLLANESLIKAVEARLDKNPGEVTQAARQGYALAPFFAEQLPIFEKQDQSFRYYVEDMFNSIDLNREKNRIASIKFDAAPLVRLGKQVPVPAAQPKLSPSAETLEQADDLYTKRTLDPAKDLYLKALEQTGSPDEHARAWYGLARIAVLQKEPDSAVKLFEKTLGASPDDPTKAWSLYYLGRLAQAAANQEHEARLDQQAQADLDRAVKMFQSAIAVPGASDQARSAARTELDKLPK